MVKIKERVDRQHFDYVHTAISSVFVQLCSYKMILKNQQNLY